MFPSKRHNSSSSDSHHSASAASTPNGRANTGAKYEMSPFIARSDSDLGFDNESLETGDTDETTTSATTSDVHESHVAKTFIEINGDFCYMHQNPNKALKVKIVVVVVIIIITIINVVFKFYYCCCFRIFLLLFSLLLLYVGY